MQLVIRGVNAAFTAFAAVSLAIIAFGTMADALSRSFGAGSLSIVYDLNLTVLVMSVFLTLGAVQFATRNPEFTFITDRLSEEVARWVQAVGLFLISGAVAWMTFVSTTQAFHAFATGEERMGIARFATWPAKAAVAFGLFWLCVILCWQVVALIRGRNLEEFADEEDF